MTLAQGTDDGDAIAREARALLKKGALDEPLRLIGVGVTKLAPAETSQLSLLEAMEGPKAPTRQRRKLNSALDRIHDRFGSEAVVRGGQAQVRRAGLSDQIKRGEETD